MHAWFDKLARLTLRGWWTLIMVMIGVGMLFLNFILSYRSLGSPQLLPSSILSADQADYSADPFSAPRAAVAANIIEAALQDSQPQDLPNSLATLTSVFQSPVPTATQRPPTTTPTAAVVVVSGTAVTATPPPTQPPTNTAPPTATNPAGATSPPTNTATSIFSAPPQTNTPGPGATAPPTASATSGIATVTTAAGGPSPTVTNTLAAGVIPTNTATATRTPVSSSPSATSVPGATNTPIRTATPTRTVQPAGPTNTPVPSATASRTPPPTTTPLPTFTPTITLSPTATACPPPDSTTGFVASFSFRDGDTFSTLQPTIVITYSQPMDRTTIAANIQVKGPGKVDTTVVYDPNALTATVTFDGPLKDGATYTISVRRNVQNSCGDKQGVDYDQDFSVQQP